MASKAVKPSFIRQVATKRYFSAQACPAPIKCEPKLSSATLTNNVFVASLDNGNPVARVTIAFKAGSRYEPASELGLTHVLRSVAGLTTEGASGFAITRNLQQAGATLTATSDREFFYYTLEVAQDNLRNAVKFLTNVATKQEFRPWELNDNQHRLQFDIVSLPPQVRAVDLLHRAAYRRGLGNSLFTSPKRIGKVSGESLQHYVANYFTANRCAVTAVGISQDRAVAIAQSLEIPVSNSGQDPASKYSGGELRKDMGGELAHVALALEGAKAGTPEALVLAVVAKALGNGPAVKWGSDNSILARAVGNVGPFAAAGFNMAYTDSGLFGVLLSVPKDEVHKAVKSVAGVLKKGSLESSAIQAAKNQLKVQILNEQETGTTLAEQFAFQGLYCGGVKTPKDLASEVDKITDSDISKVLSQVTKSRLSMGAAGNLVNLPYVDEI